MSLKSCCTSDETNPEVGVNVNVNVDVPKIVKYCCIAGVMIVWIIFATKNFRKMLEENFFDKVIK